MNQWLESELQRGLQGVTAPPELWDRVQSVRVSRPQATNRGLIWALAGAVALAAVMLAMLPERRATFAGNSQPIVFHCENPAQLRAWVKANTGFNVPLRDALPASIQLISARSLGGRVEIAYRAGNRDAMLMVSRADGEVSAPHNRSTGNGSAWVMNGQRFTLACADPAALQLACKLCHLD